MLKAIPLLFSIAIYLNVYMVSLKQNRKTLANQLTTFWINDYEQ